MQRPAMAGRLGFSLCALLLAGTAGCMASPEYPIRPGETAGDGALHMTEHPAYPIDPAAAAAAKPRAAPTPPPPPPADDDAPHAVPHSKVESTDLPPPSAAAPSMSESVMSLGKARIERAVALDRSSLLATTLRSVIWDDERPAFGSASGFEQVVLQHHHKRGPAAKDESAKADVGGKGKAKSARRRKHGETAQVASRSGPHHVHLRAPLEAAASADVPASEIETPYQTRVKPGERAGDVAARVHVSKEALMTLNGIKPTSKLHPGEALKIPYRLAYTVGHGDTLFAISHRFGQDMDAVAKLNGLKHEAALHLGQTILLPLTAEDSGPRGHAEGKAPQPEAASAKLIEAELAKARAAEHRAAREEAARLAAARETPSARTSVATAAAAPSQTAPSQTPPSQKPTSEADSADADNGVRMAAELNERELASRAQPAPTPSYSASGYSVSKEMAAERPATTPWSAPAPAASSTQMASSPPPASSTSAAPAPGKVANLNSPSYYPPGYNAPVLGRARPTAPTGASGPVSDADVSTAGRGRFIWPLKGAILSPFGDRGPGQRNDGLDISASTGESVKAAAGGEVVYAGSSIPGFGNLVLVKHPGGWVTAYAHLDRIEVRMRDEVSQGEEIGQAGQTGVVDRPELHFEVRYAPDPSEKARPVDPTLVLPVPAKAEG
jgi:murein DD-endopeptidase MepM/ murein hydrolase activator NlpD